MSKSKEPVRNDANHALPKKSVDEMNAAEREEKKVERTGKTMP